MAHLPGQDTNIKMLFGYNFQVANPCKDCADREVGCHGKCEKYKAYRHELEHVKQIYGKRARERDARN